jgi:hypothetical protein
MKNKSENLARNRIKRKVGRNDDLKKIQDTTLEEYKEGDYSSSWMLTFQNFKTDHIIKRTCGGTAASAVELDDIPSFVEICKNRKDQRKVDRIRTDTLRGRKRDTAKNLITEKSLIKARKYQLKAPVISGISRGGKKDYGGCGPSQLHKRCRSV